MAKKTPEPSAAPYDPKKNQDGGPDDYEAENALRDMEKYHEHKANPDMMTRIKKKAGRKLKALSGLSADLGMDEPEPPKIKSIQDIKDATQKKFGKV